MAEIKDMESTIINGREPKTSGLEGLKDMKVISAWYDSALKKKLVEIYY